MVKQIIHLALAFFTLTFAHEAHAKLAELLMNEAGQTKPIKLESADVDVELNQSTAKITYDLSFLSSHPGVIEGTFYFALPTDAYVHEFGMWIEGDYQRSAIVEAKTGRVAYESIVRRGVDPALLEWSASSNFKMRVFPIAQGKPNRIKLVVGLPMSAKNSQMISSIPLDLGKLDNFRLAINTSSRANKRPAISNLKEFEFSSSKSKGGFFGLGGDFYTFKGELKKKNFLPPLAVDVSLPEADPRGIAVRRQSGEDSYVFEMRAFPAIAELNRPHNDHAVIFWDYSLSEEDHHAARIDVLKSYLDARKPKTVEVFGFSQSVYSLGASFTTADAVIRAVNSRTYDGATRVDLLIDEMTKILGKQTKPSDLVVFTNGSDTFELNDLVKIKQIPNKNLQAFLVAPGIGGSATFIDEFSRRMAAVVLDQDLEFQDRDFNLMPVIVTKIRGSKNLINITEPARAALYPGDGLVVRGQFKKEGANQIQVTYLVNGVEKTESYKFSTEIKSEDDDNLSKLWAHARMNELMLARESNAAEIKELSITHQLMSPYTVMVVLEFCEDYSEFNIAPPKGCRARPKWNETQVEDGSVDYAVEDAVSDGEASSQAAAPAVMEASVPTSARASAPQSAQPMESMSEIDAAASEAAPIDDVAKDDMFLDFDEKPGLAMIEDSPQRDYGFEQELRTAKVSGEAKLYAAYVKLRKTYKFIPYFYNFTAGLFNELKSSQRAVDVLSNVVELKPGDARWFRVYASSLVAWGRAGETLGLFKRIVSLREEDPQSFRDYALALQATGQLEAALTTFAKVYNDKWDSRFSGVKFIAQEDLVRISRFIQANPKSVSPAALSSANSYLSKFGKEAQDKIIITASWDTDNTDVDLHVMEPSGQHIYFQNPQPSDSSGRLSHDMTQGFGPEQYRNPRPDRGEYTVKIRYYSQNRNAINEGTFVRLDFYVLENGVAKNFTKTLFVKDGQETRTALNFSYLDKNAPVPFKEVYKLSNAMLQKRDADGTLKLLLAYPVQADRSKEALRLFNIARAYLQKRQFGLVEEFNNKALAYNPNLLAAHYNNACAASMANNARKALGHLELLSLSFERNPKERKRLLASMQTDADLVFVRKDPGFKKLYDSMLIAH